MGALAVSAHCCASGLSPQAHSRRGRPRTASGQRHADPQLEGPALSMRHSSSSQPWASRSVLHSSSLRGLGWLPGQDLGNNRSRAGEERGREWGQTQVTVVSENEGRKLKYAGVHAAVLAIGFFSGKKLLDPPQNGSLGTMVTPAMWLILAGSALLCVSNHLCVSQAC